MQPPAYLGLGSNLGDRAGTLDRALKVLEERGIDVTARSSLYETEPVGGPPQGWFLNRVVKVKTDRSPEALLESCLDVEKALGRVREVRNGPRILDVDLLLYGQEVRDTDVLTLPHPRLHERLFVLIPLVEIAPDVRHPRLGLTATEMLARCKDTSRVVLHQPQRARG
jgi:2-amino-4-hydroxy-6-hydroxymethyldihydropteridine diphosphokinase